MANKDKKQVAWQGWSSTDQKIIEAQKAHRKKTGDNISKCELIDKAVDMYIKESSDNVGFHADIRQRRYDVTFFDKKGDRRFDVVKASSNDEAEKLAKEWPELVEIIEIVRMH